METKAKGFSPWIHSEYAGQMINSNTRNKATATRSTEPDATSTQIRGNGAREPRERIRFQGPQARKNSPRFASPRVVTKLNRAGPVKHAQIPRINSRKIDEAYQ
jgi:hypothetical protein